MSAKFLFAFLISVLLGCTKPGSFHMKISDYPASFPLIKPMPSFFGLDIGLLDDGNACTFYYLSRKDSSLHLFDCKDSLLSSTISLAPLLGKRIPYTSNEITGAWLEEKGRLWIDSPLSDSIFCISLPSLEIIQSVADEMPAKLPGVITSKEVLSARNTLIRSGDKLYVSVNHFYADQQLIEQTPYPFRALAAFTVEKNKMQVSKFIGDLPDNYYRKNMYVRACTAIPAGKDSLIINYHFNDSVDLFFEGRLVKRIPMKSDHSGEFKGLEGTMDDMTAVKKLFLMHQRYNCVIYDKYRRFYYRVFIHEEDEAKHDGKIRMSSTWSLLVFNSDFEKAGEFLFDSSLYDPSMLFVTREGLLVRDFSKHRPDKPLKAMFKLVTFSQGG